MSEEQNEIQWLEPSSVGAEFTKHQAAMTLAAKVPVGKSFAVEAGLNVGMLRRMADEFKPKKIVVIDHKENGIEVRRLDDKASIALFYASIEGLVKRKAVDYEFKEQRDTMFNCIKHFLNSDIEDLAKYDSKALDARKVNCITYAYIQRKLVAVAIFRKDKRGATDALKAAVGMLVAEGVLQKMTETETLTAINATAACYRIDMDKFYDQTPTSQDQTD